MQAGTERIVVHEDSGALAKHTRHALIAHTPIGIVDNRLTPTDMPGIRRHLAQLQEGPVVDGGDALRGNLLLARGEGDIYEDTFNVCNFHGRDS